MIVEVQDKLVSSELFNEEFVCNLSSCKGACCVEGDAGAPLEKEEIENIEKHFDQISHYMTSAGIDVVNKEGIWYNDDYDQPVTSLVKGKDCVFVFRDENGITKCSIEKAYREGKIPFNKPISCHLYPIRVQKKKNFESLNYDRWDICKVACTLGKELKVPVFKFLKEPIIRAWGQEFFDELNQVASEMEKQNIQPSKGDKKK